MVGIAILALLGTALYSAADWVLLLQGYSTKDMYRLLSDPTNKLLFSLGACITLFAGLTAGYVSVRAGGGALVQGLFAGLFCILFEFVMRSSPMPSVQPLWMAVLAVIEILLTSSIGGMWAARVNRKKGEGQMPEDGAWVNSMRTIWRGFLLGAGFSVSFGIVFVVLGLLIQHQVQKNMVPAGATFAEEKAADMKSLELVDTEEKKDANRDYIVGTLKNTAQREFSSVEIEVDLFKADKFVDQYSTEVSKIAAGSSEYFKIECGCKNSLPAEHDSYKVHVKNAY
jgi:hypothetical protein